MALRDVVKGAVTFIPGSEHFEFQQPKRTRAAADARYCYGVWLKHLSIAWKHGLNRIPDTVAELGPGDSLGVGISALLSGANTYDAFDVVALANVKNNLTVLDELIELFRARAPRPTKGWPDFDDCLDERLFPSSILTEALLRETLTESRLHKIREALENVGQSTNGICVRYFTQWEATRDIGAQSVDLILSHSVLQHAADLRSTYAALYAWLRGGGFMSHQIDLRSMGLSRIWNGHRMYPKWMWNILLGAPATRSQRHWLINGEPRSMHLASIRDCGLNIVCTLENHREDGIHRSQLSQAWRHLSDEDLTCSGLFVLAKRQS